MLLTKAQEKLEILKKRVAEFERIDEDRKKESLSSAAGATAGRASAQSSADRNGVAELEQLKNDLVEFSGQISIDITRARGLSKNAFEEIGANLANELAKINALLSGDKQSTMLFSPSAATKAGMENAVAAALSRDAWGNFVRPKRIYNKRTAQEISIVDEFDANAKLVESFCRDNNNTRGDRLEKLQLFLNDIKEEFYLTEDGKSRIKDVKDLNISPEDALELSRIMHKIDRVATTISVEMGTPGKEFTQWSQKDEHKKDPVQNFLSHVMHVQLWLDEAKKLNHKSTLGG